MTIRRSSSDFHFFRENWVFPALFRRAFRVGVLALAVPGFVFAQSESPEINRGRVGERSVIGEPERSKGPDLDHQRWSIPTSKTGPNQQPNPNPVPPPAPNPHPTPPYWYWPNRPQIGVGYSSAYYYYPPLTGVYSPIDPNLVIHPPQDSADVPLEPPTAGELIFSGHYDEAAAVLHEELGAESDDPERLRYLAVVLAGQRDFEAAAKLVEEVYLGDPDISVYPLDGEALFESPLELRRLVVGAVRHAQRTQTARAWLLVAVLMQAEGRDEVAFKMMGRASSQGLAEQITAAWPDPAA